MTTSNARIAVLAIAVAVYAFATYELVTVRCARASYQPTVEQAGQQQWAFVETKGGGHRGGGKKH